MLAAVYDPIAPYNVKVVRVPALPISLDHSATQSQWNLINIVSMCAYYFRKLFFPVLYAWSSFDKKFTERQRCLIAVKACSLNPVDAKLLVGDKFPFRISGFIYYLAKCFLRGRTVGLDYSGVVVLAPVGCGFKTGDEVFGTCDSGCCSQFILAPMDSMCLKPTNLSFVLASAVPLTGLTILQAFNAVPWPPNTHICIIGAAGGTGHVGVQLAKARGARVTAICSARNEAFVRSLGADSVVFYDNVPGSLPWEDQLTSICANFGKFDVVLDTVSSSNPRDMSFQYEQSFESHRAVWKNENSKYITIGSNNPLHWFISWLKRSFGYDLFPRGKLLWWVQLSQCSSMLQALKNLCENQSLVVHVGTVLSLHSSELQAGFEQLLARHVRGKICVSMMDNHSNT